MTLTMPHGHFRGLQPARCQRVIRSVITDLLTLSRCHHVQMQQRLELV